MKGSQDPEDALLAASYEVGRGIGTAASLCSWRRADAASSGSPDRVNCASMRSVAMPYALIDVEVTRPLPRLQLGVDESGVAIVSRRDGCVIGFSIHEARPGSAFEPDELGALLDPAPVDPAVLDSTGPDRPTITVAICTRDRAELLAECLAAVLALEQRPDEILVVDNAPLDRHTHQLVGELGIRYEIEPVRAWTSPATVRSASPPVTWWRSSTTTSFPTGIGFRLSAVRGRNIPTWRGSRVRSCRGSSRRTWRWRSPNAVAASAAGTSSSDTWSAPRGQPDLSLCAGHVRGGGQPVRPPGAGAAPRGLRRGPRHGAAASGWRRHRHDAPGDPRLCPRVRALWSSTGIVGMPKGFGVNTNRRADLDGLRGQDLPDGPRTAVRSSGASCGGSSYGSFGRPAGGSSRVAPIVVIATQLNQIHYITLNIINYLFYFM